MSLLSWVKEKLHRRPDPVKVEIVEKIEREKVKLNGALEDLSRSTNEVKITRRQSQDSMAGLLDETLKTFEHRKRESR